MHRNHGVRQGEARGLVWPRIRNLSAGVHPRLLCIRWAVGQVRGRGRQCGAGAPWVCVAGGALGVALVMEIWPDRSRALLAGLIGAAANVGFLLCGAVNWGLGQVLPRMDGWLSALGLPKSSIDFLVADSGWRLLMFTGAAPALLTFFIRLFVP